MRRTLSGLRVLLLALCGLAMVTDSAPARAEDFGPGFKTQAVPVDGGAVSVTVGGSGPPVLLLHGYAETSRMWKPLAKVLAPRFTVIAPDLPGIGASSIPKTGLDMKTSTERVHAAVRALGYSKVRGVGHDIGLMVSDAYAAMYPEEVEKLVWSIRFCPARGWEARHRGSGIRFYGATPEALVKGRERIY
jgi:pimeloyl-ACP methyl ester carboxylesterase